MPYWVYGLRPSESSDPSKILGGQQSSDEPLFVEAANEEEARATAVKMGIIVESIEFVAPPVTRSIPDLQPASLPPIAPSNFSIAICLVWFFRVLAFLVLVLSLMTFVQNASSANGNFGRTPQQDLFMLSWMLASATTIAVLLAIGEVLNLMISIEQNLRRDSIS